MAMLGYDIVNFCCKRLVRADLLGRGEKLVATIISDPVRSCIELTFHVILNLNCLRG